MSERHPGSDDWHPWGPAQEPRREPTWATPSETRPYQPISGSWSEQPRPPQGADDWPWSEPGAVGGGAQPPGPPQQEPRRRGPGWGAFVGGLVAVGLLAGTTGGVVGGFLTDGSPSGSTSRTAPVPTPGAGSTTRPEGSIANIAATALPSVVTLRVGGGATGSGWVYDDAGHVVTNNHVVESAGDDEIVVVLANGEQVTGRVVGQDASYDLAVVEVTGAELSPLPIGRSAQVVVGDQVIAVGAPLGLDSTVTTGIVSALDRPVTPGAADDQSFINAIQTDAAINPGNSGGPLLDMGGAVIGVNTAIARVPGSGLGGGQSGNIGVGFAIPSDQVATTVEQLIETGTAEHPVIGVYLDSGYQGEGVRVADEGPDGAPAVNPGGPAQAAGLRAGDVIVAFEGQPVTEGGELVVKIRSRRVGDTVTLTVRRDGGEEDVRMVLQGSD